MLWCYSKYFWLCANIVYCTHYADCEFYYAWYYLPIALCLSVLVFLFNFLPLSLSLSGEPNAKMSIKLFASFMLLPNFPNREKPGQRDERTKKRTTISCCCFSRTILQHFNNIRPLEHVYVQPTISSTLLLYSMYTMYSRTVYIQIVVEALCNKHFNS